jgi:hypothetical protein
MIPLYVGASWAHRSYNTDDESEDWHTSIRKETRINILDLSVPGTSNRWHIENIKSNPAYQNRPILWIYCEPLFDLTYYTGMTEVDLIEKEDWLDVRKYVNQKILEEIDTLEVPVGLVGSHSDVFDCNRKNLEVLLSSYQKTLCDIAGTQYDFLGWGPERLHKAILNNGNRRPSYSLVNEMSKTFAGWKRLEILGLFYNVHPNRGGVELFSNILAPHLQEWCSKFE